MGYFRFERMGVWRRSVDWADLIFDFAAGLPQRLQFSLGEQLRRSALSVPTNIAEGSGRSPGKESAYFYRVGRGSLYEVVNLLYISKKRQLLPASQYQTLFDEANELAAILTNLGKP